MLLHRIKLFQGQLTCIIPPRSDICPVVNSLWSLKKSVLLFTRNKPVEISPQPYGQGRNFNPGRNMLFLTCKQKIKSNPGWKLFRSKVYRKFIPGWKMHINKKYFTPRWNSPGGRNNACKLPLRKQKEVWN